MQPLKALVLALALSQLVGAAGAQDLFEEVEHHYAENDGVRIHYVRLDSPAAGRADSTPLVVLIHGFPDFWYSWRHQMRALADTHAVVAMDMRGYNKSDSPEGLEHYAMPKLVGDVLAVIRDTGREKAVVVGHDWGAGVAWQVAMREPAKVERLIILSVPHPAGFGREMATSEKQKADSQYARNFQQPDSHELLTAAGLAGWVREPEARARYVQAFERSSFDAMMNYYRANYPLSEAPESKGSGEQGAAQTDPVFPPVTCPVLVLHGRRDRYLHAGGHSGTWDHVDAELTIVMFPEVGHFVQHEAAERVTDTMVDWLAR